MLRACSEVGPDQNSRYEGFIPDILAHITEMLGVTYSIKVADFYGTCKDNKWTGMIGDVINGVSTGYNGLSSIFLESYVCNFTYRLFNGTIYKAKWSTGHTFTWIIVSMPII